MFPVRWTLPSEKLVIKRDAPRPSASLVIRRDVPRPFSYSIRARSAPYGITRHSILGFQNYETLSAAEF